MGRYLRKEQCPLCAAEGGDNRGDNLTVYEEDDGRTCYVCYANSDHSYCEGKHGNHHTHTHKPKVMKNPKPNTKETELLVERGISKRVLRLEDIGEVEGRKGVLAFPFFREGRLSGIKYRDFELEKVTGKKEVWVDGELNLFGVHTLKGRPNLIITEGETDYLTLKEMLASENRPQYDVLAMPGASTFKYVLENIPLLNTYQKIYVIPDNDKAGAEMSTSFLNVTGLSQYKVHIVSLQRHNDINDYYKARQLYELKQEIYASQPVAASPFLISAEDYNIDDIIDENEVAGFDTGYSSLNASLGGGLRPSEFMGIMSFTGYGKSSFAMNLVSNILELNPEARVLYVGTEMSYRQNLRWLAQIRNGGSWQMNLVSRREKETQIHSVTEGGRFIQMKTDYRDIKMSDVQDAIAMYGVNLVVYDVVTDLWDVGDFGAASSIARELHELTKGSVARNLPPVAVIGVAHTSGENDRLSSDKVAGGRGVSRQFTSILTIDSYNKDKSSGMPQDNIRVFNWAKKSRDYGFGAVKFKLEYDSRTMKYKEIKNDVTKRESHVSERETLQEQSGSDSPTDVPDLEVRTDATVLPEVSEGIAASDGLRDDEGLTGEHQTEEPIREDVRQMDANAETVSTGLPDTERNDSRVQGVDDTSEQKNIPPSLPELREIQRNREWFNVDINPPQHTTPKAVHRFNPRDVLGEYTIPKADKSVHRTADDRLDGGTSNSIPNVRERKRPIAVRVYPK